MKTFLDLTDDEIKQIVTDMFKAKKVTSIKRNKKYDRITCKVYVEWKSYDDNDKIIVEKLCDEITLSDPFKYETMSIAAPFSLKREDYIKLMQFCFAKGVYESYLIKNNPYLSTDSIANFVNTLKGNLKDKD